MIASAVHHVALCVDDLEAALAFYTGLLGLETLPRPDFGLPGAWLQAGDTQVHLIVAPEGVDVGSPPEKSTPLAYHLAFRINDFDEALETLQGHGLEVMTLGAEMGQMWVSDPSGNVIEFTTGARN